MASLVGGRNADFALSDDDVTALGWSEDTTEAEASGLEGQPLTNCAALGSGQRARGVRTDSYSTASAEVTGGGKEGRHEEEDVMVGGKKKRGCVGLLWKSCAVPSQAKRRERSVGRKIA